MKRIVFMSMAFLALVIAAGGGSAQVGGEDDVVPIINPALPALNPVQVKWIFQGDMTYWPAGGQIRVLINNDEEIYEKFARKYMGVSARQVDTQWVYRQIRDGLIQPRKVSSVVIKMMVSRSKMFIGFIKRSQVDRTVKIAL